MNHPIGYMRIGIDIDETIAATFFHIIPHVEKSCNTRFTWEDCIHHDMWNIPKLGITKERAIEIWDEWWEMSGANIPPVDGSPEWITILKNHGFTLFAITARNEEKRRKLTHDWINTFFPETFEEVYFTSAVSATPKTKSSVCKQLGISLMVDDNLDYALELAENGITAIVLEKPWNKHRTETHPNIIRVKDWSEIPSHILAYTKNK